MSENEIDSLEIVVEAEANRANRALSGLEKRINKAATALEKFMVMAQGGISFKNVDVDKLFSGNAMDSAARKQGKKLADELISGFNLNKSGAEVQRQVRELSQKIAGGLSANGGKPYSGLSTDLEALGKITAKNGSVAKSTSEEYQKLYNWIKTTSKIKITPETAKSLGDTYKNRVPVMKQKLSTKSGIELDSFYNEAKDMFPGLLKDANNVEDEFYQLNSALEKFYETSNSFYKPEWMEDAAYDSVISGVNEIVASIEKAKSESSDLTGSLKGVADTGKSFSDIFGAGMDTSGLERIVELTGSVRGQSASGRANRSDLKYPAQEFETLVDKFKDSSLGVDFSGMDSKQIQSKLAEYERAYERIWQSISDIRELEGTDTLGGKDWYKKIMQMNQYSNAIDEATDALKKLLSASSEDAPIERFNENDVYNDSGSDVSRTEPTSGKFMGYDPDAMKAVFGEGAENLHNYNDVMKEFGGTAFEAFNKLNDSVGRIDSSKVNTFEEQIKRLKKQLAELAQQGFSQDDPEYDRVARKLARVQVAKKQYDQEMQKAAKADLGVDEAKRAGNSFEDAAKKANIFKRAVNSIKGVANNINSVKKSFDKVGKSIQNAKNLASKAIHPFHTLKELFGGSDGGSKRNGMPFGRMIGSSIMFSTIFGAISQIKQAVKEGSDNLVQYSTEYNKSISGMVSSLLYLKNAWAVAFAPVVNVVGPYIESFIDMLAGALNAVGQFMAALTGKGFVVQAKKAWKDYGAGLDTTKDKANDTAKAIKDLQNYTLGIDELNVIQPADNSGNSGSGSGSGGSSSGSPSISDMFETIEVPNSMNKLADKFKEAIKNSDFTDIGKMLGDKLSSAMESIPWITVYRKADNFGKDLATFLNGLISPRLFYNLGATIANSINTALHTANSFAVNFDWRNLGDSLAASITGFFENWDAGLTAETFSHFGEGILEAITGFIDGLAEDKTWEKIGQKIVDFICGIDWKGLAWDFGEFFKALKKALINFPEDFKTGVQKGLFKAIFGDKMSDADMKKSMDTFDKMNELSKKISENLFKTPSQMMGLSDGDIKAADDAAKENFEDIGDWFKKRKEDIENAQGDIADWFSKKYQDARTGTENAFQDIGTWYADRKTDVKNAQSDIADWFGRKYEDARTRVTDTFQNIGGYQLDNGSIEWLQMGSLYVYEWSASDEKATIRAVDVLKFIDDDYYKGQYYENGITLYDLAVLVLTDAGVGNDDYYLDTYLKKVIIHNPLPKVKHKEALQIIANAGRCVLDYDRYGRIRIHSLFQPSVETTSNGTTYYSDIKNVDIQTQKSDFATYEKNRWLADGKMLFLQKEDVQNTGYVSSAISDENGLFTENPVITRTLEAKYKAYGIYIAFGNKLPKKFIIRTYADNVLSDTLTIQSGIANDFEIQYDFPEYDKMEIEFVETEPNSRIHVDYISIGSETSYRIEYDDLYSTPVGTQLDRIKNVKVARYLYSKSSIKDELATETLTYNGENAIYYMSDACYGYTVSIEDGKSEQSANIVSSGAYYVEIAVSGVAIGETVNITVKGYKYNVSTAYDVQTVNNRGTDKEWQNPIISDAEHSKQVATWLSDYFSSGIEYELDYRGEPAIDCGDTIGQENKYDSNLKAVVEEAQITFDSGLLGGGLVTRRKGSVDRAKN